MYGFHIYSHCALKPPPFWGMNSIMKNQHGGIQQGFCFTAESLCILYRNVAFRLVRSSHQPNLWIDKSNPTSHALKIHILYMYYGTYLKCDILFFWCDLSTFYLELKQKIHSWHSGFIIPICSPKRRNPWEIRELPEGGRHVRCHGTAGRHVRCHGRWRWVVSVSGDKMRFSVDRNCRSDHVNDCLRVLYKYIELIDVYFFICLNL